MAENDRIFFVITLQGDRGPFDRADMREHLRTGLARPEDRVRNAFGRPLGTVAEILARQATPAARPAVRPAGPARARSPLPAILITAVVLALVVMAVVLGGSPSGKAPAPPEPQAPDRPATAAPSPAALVAKPSPIPAPPVAETAALPDGWSLYDIGCTAAGRAVVGSAGWQVPSGGVDVYGTADQFRFIAIPVDGDASLTTQVPVFPCANAASKIGLMCRRDTTGSAPFVAVCLTGEQQVMRYGRKEDGGWTADMAQVHRTRAPLWLRLVRSGTTCTAFLSQDGAAWSAVGEALQMPALDGRVLIGLMVVSRDETPKPVHFTTPLLVAAGR